VKLDWFCLVCVQKVSQNVVDRFHQLLGMGSASYMECLRFWSGPNNLRFYASF